MLTLPSLLQRTSRLHGDRIAVADAQSQYTWNEFVQNVSKLAAVLQSLKVSPQQRFAILSRNSFYNAALMQAGYWLGAVPVPINYRLAPKEIAFILKDAECKLVAVEEEVEVDGGPVNHVGRAWRGPDRYFVIA